MEVSFDASVLKVNDLRDELKRRGLNPIGTKAILTQRLTKVLSDEGKTLQDFAKSLAEANKPQEPVSDEPVNAPPSSEDVDIKPTNGNAEQLQPDDLPKQQSPEPPSSIHSKESSHSSERVQHEKEHDSENPKDRERSRERSQNSDRSRGRDRSPDHEKRRSPRRTRDRSPEIKEERDGWESKEAVFLDTYNSDLSLLIGDDGFSAKPLTNDGFSMMWAGVRANYGISRGKAFFEAKMVKEIPVDNMDSLAGGVSHAMRVGWSTEKSSLALGEEPFSYGYGATAKKSCDGKFLDYGCKFSEGDVVGAFLEINEKDAIMSFSVNGVNQGECYRIQVSTLAEKSVFFPHIYVKNTDITVNFGQDDMEPWFPHGKDATSWKSMNAIPVDNRTHGRRPPSSKADCEVIMMIGLPGAGKSYYADNLCKEKPEMQYNVLGTNLILDKMRIVGLSRKRNYTGRWDALIDKANQCLNGLIAMACKRRRNYILDQTNVYPSAQRRKMRPFDGFRRRAIVIVPSDEEFRRRIDKRSKEEGKDVPEKAVLEMKGNFEIPKAHVDDEDSLFDDVTFTELQREEAEELVKKYNLEGKETRGSERRSRDNFRGRDSGGSRDFRDRPSRFDNGSRPSTRDYDRREPRGRYDNRGDVDRFRDASGPRRGNDDRYYDYGRGGNRGGPYGPQGGGGFGGFRGGYPGGGPPYEQYVPPGGGDYSSSGPRTSPFRGGGGSFRGGRDGGFPRGGGGGGGYQGGGRGGYDTYGSGSSGGYYQAGDKRAHDAGPADGGPSASKQLASSSARDSASYSSGYQSGASAQDSGGYRGGFRSGRGGFNGGRGSGFSQSPNLQTPPPQTDYPASSYSGQPPTYQQQSTSHAPKVGSDHQRQGGSAAPTPSRFSGGGVDDAPQTSAYGARPKPPTQSFDAAKGGAAMVAPPSRSRFDVGGNSTSQGYGSYGKHTGGPGSNNQSPVKAGLVGAGGYSAATGFSQAPQPIGASRQQQPVSASSAGQSQVYGGPGSYGYGISQQQQQQTPQGVTPASRQSGQSLQSYGYGADSRQPPPSQVPQGYGTYSGQSGRQQASHSSYGQQSGSPSKSSVQTSQPPQSYGYGSGGNRESSGPPKPDSKSSQGADGYGYIQQSQQRFETYGQSQQGYDGYGYDQSSVQKTDKTPQPGYDSYTSAHQSSSVAQSKQSYGGAGVGGDTYGHQHSSSQSKSNQQVYGSSGSGFGQQSSSTSRPGQQAQQSYVQQSAHQGYGDGYAQQNNYSSKPGGASQSQQQGYVGRYGQQKCADSSKPPVYDDYGYGQQPTGGQQKSGDHSQQGYGVGGSKSASDYSSYNYAGSYGGSNPPPPAQQPSVIKAAVGDSAATSLYASALSAGTAAPVAAPVAGGYGNYGYGSANSYYAFAAATPGTAATGTPPGAAATTQRQQEPKQQQPQQGYGYGQYGYGGR